MTVADPDLVITGGGTYFAGPAGFSSFWDFF